MHAPTPPPQPRLRARVCASASDISARGWGGLTARPPASFNGSRAWVAAALATVHAGLTPHLIAVEDGTRLVALLPLVLEPVPFPIARFVGTPHNDLTDVLVLPGYERAAAAVVVGELNALASRGWSVDLDLVDPAGVLARMDREPAILTWEPSVCAPVIDLCGPWRWAASPRRRGRWDRSWQLLQARHLVEFRWIDGPDVVGALREFVEVRERRQRSKGQPTYLPPIPLLEAVCPAMAASGRCAFAELRIDGSMVARDLYVLDPPSALLWLRALDVAWRRWPCGHLLLRAAADSLVANGYAVLDLGCGDEPYKFLFGAERRALLRASLGRPAPP